MPKTYDPLLDNTERELKRPKKGTDWAIDAWDEPDEVARVNSNVVRRDRRWISRPLGIVALLALFAVAAFAAFGYWLVRQVNPEVAAGDPVDFTVSDGEDLVALSHRLEDAGFITDAGVFQWYVKDKGGIEITPGFYKLKPMDTMGNILKRLRTPPAKTYTEVNFPEGFSIRQMGTRLNSRLPKLSREKFIAVTTDGSVKSKLQPKGVKSLEGLLFPATYQVSNSETEAEVTARMVAQMERVARQTNLTVIAKARKVSAYKLLIIASIIEREAKTDEDRALISSVIWNRLAIGMPLQVDATLFYNQDPDLSVGELRQIDTPYNTYKYKGLPPTPIANPGRASIQAALEPAADPLPSNPVCRAVKPGSPCKYYYYVLKDADTHVFAVTAQQHEANVVKARAAGLLN